jgi:hypothetical protein
MVGMIVNKFVNSNMYAVCLHCVVMLYYVGYFFDELYIILFCFHTFYKYCVNFSNRSLGRHKGAKIKEHYEFTKFRNVFPA